MTRDKSQDILQTINSKTEKNGFDESTNQTIGYEGIQISIPSYMVADDDQSSYQDGRYYYAENGETFFFIMFLSDDISDIDFDEETLIDQYTEGFLDSIDNSTLVEQKSIHIAGIDALDSKVTVSADKNPDYNTDPGEDTEDKVFLLSISEAEKYSSLLGEYTFDDDWWLRSPGSDSVDIAVVSYGSVDTEGQWHTNDNNIRPALWINLEP